MEIGCVEMLFGCNHDCSLLSLLQSHVFLHVMHCTEISPEQLPFPYFISSGGKFWVPSVTHWCVLGTPALCRVQKLLLPLLGLVPWLFHYSGSGVSLPMAMAAMEGVSQQKFFGDFLFPEKAMFCGFILCAPK